MSLLRLTNPHSVLAALECRPSQVRRIFLPPRGAGPAWEQVEEIARNEGVPIEEASGREGGAKSKESGRSGSAAAEVDEQEGKSEAELFDGADQLDEGRGLWLALDQIQDPRNLGALFRSAAFFGVRGVILTRDRSAPLSAVAYDAASGGLEHVPYAQVTNLSRALEAARRGGVWILGGAQEAEMDIAQVPRDRPWLLVLGNEEKGLRRLTREGCDQICCIKALGPVGALNVSVAGAVLMSALRQADGGTS